MRTSSSLMFALVLVLSFALLIWWTTFLLLTSQDVVIAADRLAADDIAGAVAALGAEDAPSLARIGASRQLMFASESMFFAVVLGICGVLYYGSVRRETALQRNQDRFLAAATHELKTPLATISLLLESLRDDRVPAAKRTRYLTNGLLEAERLERGLHNVLTAAGLRSAGPTMHLSDGDLVQDVHEAVEAMRARADAADIRLTVDMPEQLIARRDGTALQLVLRNLLDNAIKYSPAGSTIDVSLRRDGADARLAIRDRGRGLDDDERKHAFEPFWRGGEQVKGGTGLGLHLVQEMVQAHGGTVRAESSGRDRGSTFTVNLPMEERV